MTEHTGEVTSEVYIRKKIKNKKKYLHTKSQKQLREKYISNPENILCHK